MLSPLLVRPHVTPGTYRLTDVVAYSYASNCARTVGNTFRLITGDLWGRGREEAPSKQHIKRERTMQYRVVLLPALVRRSPRVLAFEWVPPMRAQDDIARSTPRFLCMIFFFFESGAARSTCSLAPDDCKASHSGTRPACSGVAFCFHLSSRSDANNTRLHSSIFPPHS